MGKRIRQLVREYRGERRGDGRLVFIDRAEAYYISEILLPMAEDQGENKTWMPFYDTDGEKTYDGLNDKFYDVMFELYNQPLTCGQCQYGYGCDNCQTCDFRIGGPLNEEE